MLTTLWNTLLFYPILNALLALYSILGGSLGGAVIILAIIVRLILIPATKKQTEMTKKMSALKPRLEKIQKKYKNNPQQLSKEQMKLYKEVGYNPLGCLTSFLPQILVLAAMIGVIRAITAGNFNGLYPFVKDAFFNGEVGMLHTKFLFIDLAKNYMEIANKSGYFAVEGIAYLVLSLLVGLVQYFSTKFLQVMQGQVPPKKDIKKKNKDKQMSPEEMQAQLGKSMTTIFPLMTVFFTLSAPAVLGIYWLVQSLMFIIQYFLIDFNESKAALRDSLKLTRS